MPDPTLRDNYIALYEHRMSELSNLLSTGEIDISDWQIAMRSELRDAFASQIWSATDGDPGMNDYLKMGNVIQQQDKFLENFAHDIADGNVSGDAIGSRAQLYARSSKTLYWKQATGDANLPTMPGQQTCLGNCNCEWVDNGDGSWTWDRTNEKGTSCEDCIHNSEIYNPYWPDDAEAAA